MEIKVEKDYLSHDIALIRLGGFIDSISASEIERVIDELLKTKCYKIIIDLKDVEYIGSSGWSTFLNKIKFIRENGGDLKLARMQPDVFELYKLLEFFWFLRSYESIDEAVSDFELGLPPMP